MPVTLKPVDRVEITTLLDNTVDALLPSTDTVKRYVLRRDFFESETLIAEHGFSAAVSVTCSNTTDSFLFDAGLSRTGLVHNLDVLEIKPGDFHAIVVSHGHADHTNGLMGLVRRMGQRRIPLVLHPDAFLQRKVAFPDGREINLPPPDRKALAQEGVEFIEERAASCILSNLVLVTGQIARSTEFEKGLPFHFALQNSQWQPDALVHDDQAVVFHLQGKGLIILTGCGHAGVINTIRHAQLQTGVQEIHAVVGGFHLSGLAFEPIIPPTIAALKAMGCKVLIPSHCTGWKAMHAIAREMPGAFVQNSVGTRFIFA